MKTLPVRDKQKMHFGQSHSVTAEAARIKSHGEQPQDMIELCDLDRMYPAIGPTPAKHALRGLNVGISVGEVCCWAAKGIA
jgi:hypothetical protein